MNYLSLEDLAKSYGVRELFNGLTYGINKGQRVALIARNGSGKSTLLKIIAGKEHADEGNVALRKGVKMAYLGQVPELPASATVMEAMFDNELPAVRAVMKYEACLEKGAEGEELQEAMDAMDQHNAWDYEAKVKQLLGRLEITDLKQAVNTMSGGQQKRLALAKVLFEEPEFLLLDEPTNHLDVEMIEWLEHYLSSSSITLFMITHDRLFLDNVCNEILELDQGRWHKYKGNYQYYIQKKAEREEQEAVEVGKAKSLMRKELDWIRRQPKARGTKAKYRVDAFEGIKEKASRGKQENEVVIDIKMRRVGSKILELHQVSKSYGERCLIDNFRYVFKNNEKVGVAGRNGIGKSTLLDIIMGKVEPDKGKVVRGETIAFGYYTQKGMKLEENKRLIDVIKDIAEVIPLMKGKKLTASQLLERFLFPKDMHHQFVGTLSGGECRRLFLLTIIMDNPNFLILDEPTNDLDIATLNVLEDFLQEYEGCVLAVSHDRYFLNKLADHLFVFEGDGSIKDFNGTYAEYKLLQKELRKEEEGGRIKRVQEKPAAKVSTSNKLTYKERLELEALEVEVAELEKQKEELTAEMNAAAVAYDRIQQISIALEELLSKLEEKSDRWLVLAERQP
jgi:ATP-binding cassette subfamily F protein uup